MVESVERPEVEKTDSMGGSARIEGTRVRVSDIVIAHEYRGWEPRKIAEQFPPVTVSGVYSALEYYEENKKEIREEIQERERKFQSAAEE